MGHIRDLPKSKLGVDIENNFEPEYINIRGKGDLIKSLKDDAKKAKKVFLATDPDREGEAIAWHLANILDVDKSKMYRVTFNEITQNAVKSAIKNPRKIDMDLTDAQQARRVLDRIVGYKISPVLWKKVQKGLSAGRVQSVAVKLIVDREEEIENFIPEEYWNIYASLRTAKSKKTFDAKFYGKDNKKLDIHSKEEIDGILKDLENAKFIVDEVKKGEKKRNPAPPFTTSTMQQEASRKLNFSIKKTMQVAQGLYEGVKIPGKGIVGLITYMRTDSTRISEEARAAAKQYIESEYGEEYYENRYYKSKADSQDAHEAIRPTYVDLVPDDIKKNLTNDQYKLYKLIYNRFIASQMAAAVYDTVSVKINANDYNFRANGQTLKFKGFMTLYVEGTDEKQEDEENDRLNNILEFKTVLKDIQTNIANVIKYPMELENADTLGNFFANIFSQDPSLTGMDYNSVYVATILASMIGTLILGLVANVPYVQSAGLGLNALFTYTICGTLGFTWQQALAMVFICGVINVLITITSVRKKVIKAIPSFMQDAITVGIGLALLGVYFIIKKVTKGGNNNEISQNAV